MLKNYLVVALRSFRRNTIFSAIHVLGLAIGISASLVIYLIVRFENSFDKFEPDADRIYRVVLDINFNGSKGHSSAVPAPVANAAQNEISGIESTVPVMQFQGDATAKVVLMEKGKQTVFRKQEGVVFTNDQYFKLLPFHWLIGSPETSLKNPFSIVLTESRARLYFPGIALADLPGKQVQYNDINLFVTGIVSDLNQATDFTAVEFISYATIAKTNLQDRFMMNVWNDWMTYSRLYIKLSPTSNAIEVANHLNALLRKYNPDAIKEEKSMAFQLQPLSDIHFNSTYSGFGQRVASKDVLYGLLAIAAFLLLLGCINFTNLTTAQASQRAKEIGIRKTVGSSKKQLVQQFLSETFMTTLIATVVSIGITPLILDLFAGFLPPELSFNKMMLEPSVLWFLLCLTVFVSLLAGLYPALILAGYQPVAVLKNQSFAGATTRSAGMRKVLTVSQFVIAQFFVIAAFMVGKQIHYSLNQDLGFRKEAIITFDLPRDTVASHRDHILNAIASLAEVQDVSGGFVPPAIPGAAFTNISYQDGKHDSKINVQLRFGDSHYLSIYKIALVAGRNVREGADVREVLINENYSKELGFTTPADALGKELTLADGKKVEITGVMHDFHEGSFHVPIMPIVFQASTSGSTIHIALHPETGTGGQWQHAIASVQKIVKDVYPDNDFSYQFFDESIAALYSREKNISTLLNWATGLSILISCLGLLGLVMFTSATRTKEIGVRKILGASVSSIVSLLSGEFIRLVLIAFIIAAPLAWWAIDKWLEDFAYRTPMSWWVFGACGLLLMFIAMITLSIQTVRTARANPVTSLRSE